MKTESRAQIEKGKLFIEAEVFDVFAYDGNRRMILLSRSMSMVTKLQQEIFAMSDSEAASESDKIMQLARANRKRVK